MKPGLNFDVTTPVSREAISGRAAAANFVIATVGAILIFAPKSPDFPSWIIPGLIVMANISLGLILLGISMSKNKANKLERR